jgi:hypothetical protein
MRCPPEKSEHKKAVQTSQKALHRASRAEEAIANLGLSTKPTKLQKLAWIGGGLGGLSAFALALYGFWP